MNQHLKIFKYAGIAITIASFIFIINTILSYNIDYGAVLSLKCLSFMLIALAFPVIINVSNVFCWTSFLSFFSTKKCDYRMVFGIYTRANLSKYLPGNLGHFVSRQLFGASLGVTQIHLAIISMLEVLYSAGAAIFISLVFSWSYVSDIIWEKALLNKSILLIAVFCACTFIICFFSVMRKNHFLKKLSATLKNRLFRRLFLMSFILSLICFFLVCIMFFMFLSISDTHVDLNVFFLIIASNSASWLIGFITPGSPGGIGVREAALVLMLSPYLPKEIVLTTAVIQRIDMVFGEVIAYFIGVALRRKTNVH
jgi:hypothetical protein